MSEQRLHLKNSRDLSAEQARIEQRIYLLQQRSDSAVMNYQQELDRLRRDYERSADEANETLRNDHRRALDEISATYNAHRAQMRQEILQLRTTYNRQLEEENQAIYRRIKCLELRLDAQTERDRQTADEYLERMRLAWLALRSRDELQPFVERHASTLEQAESAAAEAYRLSQYQAVTAIMVNSCSLISMWEQEAQSTLEEWQALYRLCTSEMACMRSAMESSVDQSVNCDGSVSRTDLSCYDPDGFATARQTLASDEMVFADVRGLMVEDMRVLLHNLEHDRRNIDQLIEHSAMLHRAHVRRLRCLQAVTRALAARGYRRQKTRMRHSSLNDGLRALFDSRYLKALLLVEITTPQPESGQARVTVSLLPQAAMDEALQQRLCADLTRSASAMLERQTYRPVSVSQGNVFRNQSQMYQAQVYMQYQI